MGTVYCVSADYTIQILGSEHLKQLSSLTPNKLKASHLYIIAADDRGSTGNYFAKIGVAEDPMQRIKNLQCGNHLELVFDTVIPCFDPFGIESALHSLLDPMHFRGEWFIAYDTPQFELLDAARTLLNGVYEKFKERQVQLLSYEKRQKELKGLMRKNAKQTAQLDLLP